MIKRILKHSFSLLNTDHVRLGERWNYQNVISPYHRIYYIDEGKGELSDMEKTLQLEAGFLYIIPSFTLCNMVCKSYLSQYFVQFFEESSDGISLFANNHSIARVAATDNDVINFKRLVAINPGRGINRSDNPKIYEKDMFYQEYQELNNHQNMANFLETQGILLQLVSRFAIPELLNVKPVRFIPAKVLDTISFISVNLHTPITISLLAGRVNLHPDYFSRLFEQGTGIRPLAYLQEKRIERAQYLMVTSQDTYSEIAEMTGFESLSHFSRTFKKITGISPGVYKRRIYNDF
ncbi:AraC family transcriptional regulator [Mucilaginibacter sp. HMF5004]|uniref:helix-turn-helix domain-containing protein n=1 Tax=Mucilaginibacter rivuli TaxID=2857527 RepID=UPI001C5E07BE|nr:AraC family transcriptional regulator [Mucilaginibacter rivuli]MBW4888421.1 AraC family transcriptional regulator [Mucilaginibacter rivuli]